MTAHSADAMPIDPRRDIARLAFRTEGTASLEVSKPVRVVIGANQGRVRSESSETSGPKTTASPLGATQCTSYVAGTGTAGTAPTAPETEAIAEHGAG